MAYFRIRKEWNNGKWTKDQKGAYNSYEAALSNYTSDMKEAGYKIFSPEGEVLYPITYNEIAQIMYDDGVISDLPYWSGVFDGNTPVNINFLTSVVRSYHEKLSKLNINSSLSVVEFHYGDITVHKIDPHKFKIVYFDDRKFNLHNLKNTALIFNAGYFGNYDEGGVGFTLPSANLVADIDFESINPVAAKYIRERKVVDNKKLHFSAFANSSSQFRKKNVSTLVVDKNYNVAIRQINDVNSDDILYAVSGAPVIRGGKLVTDYRSEGWDNSIVRATYHGFLGIKDNDLYYVYLETHSKNCLTGEVFDKLNGFDELIKLDGGGSFYCNRLGSETYVTENRRINNYGVVEL